MGIQNYSKNTHWRNAISTTYGSEVVIPTEVGLTSFWMESYDKNKNEEAMQL